MTENGCRSREVLTSYRLLEDLPLILKSLRRGIRPLVCLMKSL